MGARPALRNGLVGEAFGGTASPDGRQLAFLYFTMDPKGGFSPVDLVVSSFGGHVLKRFPYRDTSLGAFAEDEHVQWSRDGSALYYADFKGAHDLWKRPLAGGPPVRIAHLDEPPRYCAVKVGRLPGDLVNWHDPHRRHEERGAQDAPFPRAPGARRADPRASQAVVGAREEAADDRPLVFHRSHGQTESIYRRYAIVAERDIADGLRKIAASSRSEWPGPQVGGIWGTISPPRGSLYLRKLLMGWWPGTEAGGNRKRLAESSEDP